MKLKAYAKVNLLLKVVGTLDNGYHDLQMVNVKINIADQITIKKSLTNQDTLTFLNSSLDPKTDNLVLKCLDITKKYYHINDFFDIKIKKEIPIGAGLGGGSADVSSIINYLLKKYHLKITKEFIDIIKNVSSDLIYMLNDDCCIVENLGEVVTKVEPILPKKVLVIYPNIVIKTKDIFQKVTTFSKKQSHQDLIQMVNEKKYQNDLEQIVRKEYPIIDQLLENLNQKSKAIISGSGSSIIVFDFKKINNNFSKDFFKRKVKVISRGRK